MDERNEFSKDFCDEVENINFEKDINFFTRSISSHNKFLKNPSITKFNALSKFIYDLDEGSNYINSVKNANYIKLNDAEKKNLEEKCKEIQAFQDNNNGAKLIYIEQNILKEINDYFNFKVQDESLTLFLKNEYNKKNKNKNEFTTRKLANKYFIEKGKKVSHTTINMTLKNKLGLHFLKVVPKSSKILSIESIICSMSIIKIIARCIKERISIIYCDESSIINTNNNFRAWIKPKENFYVDITPKTRYNLIMAINEMGVLYYDINSENTNEKIFINFIQNLKQILNKKNIKYYAIFMDNLSVHKTKNLIKLYVENGINVIFNTPYFSNFNSIELAFRSIKNLLYKKVYPDISKVIEDVHNIINTDNFQKTILFNLKETFLEYLKFFERYKSIDFNKYKTNF